MSLSDRLARRLMPLALRRWWRRGERVDRGDLGSLEPPGRLMGLERGQPLCRWYIERFLAGHADRVRGRVLEFADDAYTVRFGGSRVSEGAVMHATPGNAAATIVGDITTGTGIPDARFDTIIATQVLQCVFDVQAAVRTLHRILAPGGTLLLTVPAIAPVSRYDAERWGEYWHFTEQSVTKLLAPSFGADATVVTAEGNHAVAHAYLAGMAAEELDEREMLPRDPEYPIVITAAATKG